MKVLLDTCVIYPTVMRQLLLRVAQSGAYTPLWSARIIQEWMRAAQKLGPDGVAQAQSEAVMLKAAWSEAEVQWPAELEARLWLPDPADTHVLAAAIAGSADLILTLNAKDFPRNILEEEGIRRAEPDGFLLQLWQAHDTTVSEAAVHILGEARRLSGEDWSMRRLLKKARMPRLAKALG